jgi:SHS family lactate transporter-like MFS transporter
VGVSLSALQGWTPAQKHVVVAGFLGWTLDAFDFFLLVFVITDVASEFQTDVPTVTLALVLTLAMRPLGAFVFGRLADRFGRRPILMIDVATYSALAFATAFSPNLVVFMVLRTLFGIAMGGEWGVGASLTMETVRAESRGLVSGLLQSGYPCGYLFASIAFAVLYPHIGWRGMFMVGIAPALLILYIRRHVPESPGWVPHAHAAGAGSALAVLRRHWRTAVFGVVLMTAFNFLSHGTQDLYPTFMQEQRQFDHATVSTIAILYNIGAILGGIGFGMASQHYGRRRIIVIAALLSILAVPLWAFAPTAALLGLGAFLMQVFVQGCWGIVPAYLNEISPPEARGTFPGTVYQLGNFIASSNARLQATMAVALGGAYSMALAAVAVAAALAIAVLAAFGREAKDVDLTVGAAATPPGPLDARRV